MRNTSRLFTNINLKLFLINGSFFIRVKLSKNLSQLSCLWTAVHFDKSIIYILFHMIYICLIINSDLHILIQYLTLDSIHIKSLMVDIKEFIIFFISNSLFCLIIH